MKQIITLALAMGLFIGCKKTTETVVPKEPEKPKELVIKASKWASYDATISNQVKKSSWFMTSFKTEKDLEIYYSIDKSSPVIATDILTASYTYKYPKFYLIDQTTGKEVTNELFIGTFVNDTTLNFYNKVFYKVK